MADKTDDVRERLEADEDDEEETTDDSEPVLTLDADGKTFEEIEDGDDDE